MHSKDVHELEQLGEAVLAYAEGRLKLDPVPLDHPRTQEELDELAGQTVTPEGITGRRALELFSEVLAPACLSIDHPRFLSFIPCAPTSAAAMFDLVVGASSVYAGSWLEGSGAVWAENQALAWIAGLVGLPEGAGGVFVPGGTIGNLSALVAARYQARAKAAPGNRPFRIAGSAGAHSSIASAADVMDAEFVPVPVDEAGRLTGAALAEVLTDLGPETFFAVVATSGTTNLGIIDDLASVGLVAHEHGLWFHVDGAYGGAGLVAPSVRAKYAGIEQCDSFIVDPHKWLFAPFDCCALIYRRPELAREAHTQRAPYLDVLTDAPEWNPTDFSVGLTRRARGLPFWFSLATHGTDAYAASVERTLEVTRFAAAEITRRDGFELIHEPDLSVVVFRRLGWAAEDYHAWSDAILDEGMGFIVPTSHHGETLARFAIVNPLTSEDDIREILDSMAAFAPR